MKRKIAVPLMLSVIILCFVVTTIQIAPRSKAATLTVDDDGPADYHSIQVAVIAANAGDTVYVYSGTYHEHVMVDKTLNLTGEDSGTTIIDGGGNGDVVRITADWVNISGFTVRNSGPNGAPRDAGIEVSNAHNVTISNNMFSSNRDAIYLYNSNYSLVADNIVDDFEGIHIELSRSTAITGNTLSNDYSGIYLDSSISIEITDNAMTGDGLKIGGNFPEYWDTHDIDTSNTVNGKPVYYWKNRAAGTVPSGAGQVILANCTNIRVENQEIFDCYIGIILGYSNNNIISNNNASSNQDNGMYLFYSDDNLIEGNTYLENMEGIYFIGCNENTITGNHFSDNAGGIVLGDSDGNIISNNTVSGNLFGVMLIYSDANNISDNSYASNWAGPGIYIGYSSDNIITMNTIFDNKYGINVTDSFNNKIYHNNITSNTFQASDDTISGNQWDNGYPSGGNYWDDYTGADTKNGPNQDISGSDGIGDTPYSIDFDSLDKYPLIKPWGEDTIPPEIELVEPSNNSVIKPGTIITLSISDINLHEVTCSINGGPYQNLVSPYDIDTKDWEDGNYRIDVYAEDTSDNTNTASFNIIVDSTPPTISLNSPVNGSIVNSAPEIDLTISDANLDEVSYSVNAGTQLPLFVPYIIDGSSWPEGENTLAIYANDLAGNSNERWFVFTKDSVAPEISLTSPENESLLIESTNLDFEVSDEHLKSVSYSINQCSFTTLEEPYDLDTTGWDDGEYNIIIRADDLADNEIEKWFVFRLDTSPPSISLTSPVDGGSDVAVDGKIIIEFNEPMDCESVESAILITPYIEYTCNWTNDNKTLTLNFSEPLEYDTLYQISISSKAKDLAGRELDGGYDFEFTTIGKPKEKDEEGFPIVYLLLALLMAIVAAVVIVALAMAKKKKAPGEVVEAQVEAIDAPQTIQLTCSNCNNPLQVNDIGTTQNVTCPFCSTLLTVESRKAAVQMPQPQPQQPTINISCPKCRYGFTVVKTGSPLQVQCPNCGVKGKLG